MPVDAYAFTNVNEMGPACEPETAVPVDIWRKVLDLQTGEPTSYVKRERFRTIAEVYKDLAQAMNVEHCDKCDHERKHQAGRYAETCEQCGEGEYSTLIDEYLSCGLARDEEAKQAPVGPFWRIACFAVTGANEGHYVHIGAYDEDGKYRDWAIAKTFRGFEPRLGNREESCRVARGLKACGRE